MSDNTLRGLYIVMLIFLSILQTRGVLWLCPDPAWAVGCYAFFCMLFAFENLVLLEDLREKQGKVSFERCNSVSVVNEILYQNFMLNLEKMSLHRAHEHFTKWRMALPQNKAAFLMKHGQSCPNFKTKLAKRLSEDNMSLL
jgi:hypothetical protein